MNKICKECKRVNTRIKVEEDIASKILMVLIGFGVSMATWYVQACYRESKELNVKQEIRRNIIEDLMQEAEFNNENFNSTVNTFQGFYISKAFYFSNYYHQYFTIKDSKVRSLLLSYFDTINDIQYSSINKPRDLSKFKDSMDVKIENFITVLEESEKNNYNFGFNIDQISKILKKEPKIIEDTSKK